jgi:succinate dehydrogenase/fumarate reductase flavoprotein subunit
MNNIDQMGTVITTDVLILGAGGAGMCAALKAKEYEVDVLILDKCGIGWAGQIPIGGGIVAYVDPQQVEEWYRRVTEEGNYFNNQEWTHAIAADIHKSTVKLADLGVPFLRDKGEIARLSWEKGQTMTLFDAPKSLLALKKKASSMGIRMFDKIYTIDLLQQDGRVVGAVGLGLVDCKTYIFNAKAVIIATGGCGFMHEKTYSFCLGEGPAMGYRAGAVLINTEFGSGYVYGARVLGKQFIGIHYYMYLENVLGEKIMEIHYPDLIRERRAVYTHDHRVIDAMLKEVEAGHGPIYLNLRDLTPEQHRNIAEDRISDLTQIMANDNLNLLKDKASIDPARDKIEMIPLYLHGGGGLKIDLECRTTLDGLWAAGAASSTSWSGGGGHPGGIGIASAMVTGFRAGESAGRYAMSEKHREIAFSEARKTTERVLSPLGRTSTMDAADIIYTVHRAVVPMKYSLKREAGRLKEALGIVQEATTRLARVGAGNYHDLARYHQAESMILAADFHFRAAMMREESRASHYREDFPARDDKNWFRWILVQEKDGTPVFSAIPVPVEKYRLQPHYSVLSNRKRNSIEEGMKK